MYFFVLKYIISKYHRSATVIVDNGDPCTGTIPLVKPSGILQLAHHWGNIPCVSSRFLPDTERRQTRAMNEACNKNTPKLFLFLM